MFTLHHVTRVMVGKQTRSNCTAADYNVFDIRNVRKSCPYLVASLQEVLHEAPMKKTKITLSLLLSCTAY